MENYEDGCTNMPFGISGLFSIVIDNIIARVSRFGRGIIWSFYDRFKGIGHYNPSVRIIDLVYHITFIVCVNFIREWRNLPFIVDSERLIFF